MVLVGLELREQRNGLNHRHARSVNGATGTTRPLRKFRPPEDLRPLRKSVPAEDLSKSLRPTPIYNFYCGWGGVRGKQWDKRPAGIGPASPVWETGVLPLYDGRVVVLQTDDARPAPLLGELALGIL